MKRTPHKSQSIKLEWFVTCFLLFVLCAGGQLSAQSNHLDRKFFQENKIGAEKGDAACQCSLGWEYMYGKGVEQDQKQGIKWYQKAVAQGSAEAEFYLASCYDNGEGVEQNISEAVSLRRKSAEQGFAHAEHDLGVSYEHGNGVLKDYVEAAKWYRKAALQGDVLGQVALAVCYHAGIGVETNESEAALWYRKAADQGNVQAQYNLALQYQYGQGVAQDSAEAVKWYRRAANQGDHAGQGGLGVSYAEGDGVPKNYVEAYKWLNLASAQGDQFAKKSLAFIEQKMTSSQIAEAQALSSQFVPQEELPNLRFDTPDSPMPSEKPTATGTGFFITDDGYLISNYHVVKDATKVRLLTGSGLIDATLVKVDEANDLALLKSSGRFTPLPIAASRTVDLGGTVATVGFPNIGLQGFAPKLAKGEIASLSGAGDDPRYFQISVPVQPGNSGGALVDEQGNVIGIVSAKLDASAALAASGALPENVNYAVKSSLLLSFLESVPDVDSRLKTTNTKDAKFEDVVKSAQDAAVLVLVY